MTKYKLEDEMAAKVEPADDEDATITINIVDYDDADVNGQTSPNEERLTEEQIIAFCTGMVNGGFKEAEQIDCGGTQCCVEAKMDTNITRVCLDTFFGNLTNEESTWWLRTDILVALGSNRFMFKLPNLSFAALGEWIAKKVLQWNNK